MSEEDPRLKKAMALFAGITGRLSPQGWNDETTIKFIREFMPHEITEKEIKDARITVVKELILNSEEDTFIPPSSGEIFERGIRWAIEMMSGKKVDV